MPVPKTKDPIVMAGFGVKKLIVVEATAVLLDSCHVSPAPPMIVVPATTPVPATTCPIATFAFAPPRVRTPVAETDDAACVVVATKKIFALSVLQFCDVVVGVAVCPATVSVPTPPVDVFQVAFDVTTPVLP